MQANESWRGTSRSKETRARLLIRLAREGTDLRIHRPPTSNGRLAAGGDLRGVKSELAALTQL